MAFESFERTRKQSYIMWWLQERQMMYKILSNFFKTREYFYISRSQHIFFGVILFNIQLSMNFGV